MPNINSYADIIRDWESLLVAGREHPDSVADAERHRLALEEHLAATKAVKDRQATAQALKQRATQDLKEMVAKGRELAIRLRGVVRANVGPKDELLTQFGIAPIRPRAKRKPITPTPTPQPPTSPPTAQPADGTVKV